MSNIKFQIEEAATANLQQHYGLARFITPWAAEATQTLLALQVFIFYYE